MSRASSVDRAIAPVLDRSTAEVLAANLSAADPNEVLYALSILESDQQASYPPIRVLLNHPAAEVRQKAISVLDAAGDKTIVPQIEALLRDPSPEVRTEALLYLAHHGQVDPLERIQQLGDFADFSIRSSDPGLGMGIEFIEAHFGQRKQAGWAGKELVTADAWGFGFSNSKL